MKYPHCSFFFIKILAVSFCVALINSFLVAETTFSDSPESLNKKNKLPQISVLKNRFVDEEGNPVLFRGLALADPYHLNKQDKWDNSYFVAAKEWNANVLRLPVHPKWMREVGIEQYLEWIDQSVEWATELDMYLIIDWHTIGNPDNWIPHRDIYHTSKEETFYFWYRIANRYKNNTTVAFYELYNEPTNYAGQMGRLSWTNYKNLLEEIIYMIFQIDPTAIPLVAGFDWGYDISHIKYEPIDFEGIAYVTHPYPQKREKPWLDKWYEDWGFAAENYPLFATEFGFMGEDEDGAHVPVISDETYGEEILEAFKKWNVSWTVWVFDAKWSPRLFEDWDYTPSRQGRFFKKKLMELNSQ